MQYLCMTNEFVLPECVTAHTVDESHILNDGNFTRRAIHVITAKRKTTIDTMKCNCFIVY